MATTWTCSDGHTHDASKPGWKHPQGIKAGLDIECRTAGDRIIDWNYASNTVAPATSAEIHRQWTASNRRNTNI